MNKIVGASRQPEFLKKVKAGLDPENSLAGREKKYAEGCRDRAFVLDLINRYRNANDYRNVTRVSNEFLSSLKEEDMFTHEVWRVISYYYASSYRTEWWKYIEEHSDRYIAVVWA